MIFKALFVIFKALFIIFKALFIIFITSHVLDGVEGRDGGLGSSTIFKNLMSPTPRRKWYLTTGCRAH